MMEDTFICGVCEGFYGKPWSINQRKNLFQRMNRFRMNTYLYAPKDDYKHRLRWRDLYNKTEAENLKDLIKEAEINNLTFVYALSPGIDITYSSEAEKHLLTQKLNQVASFGCKAFALLFDDIETELCYFDRRKFELMCEAQVHVTNHAFATLNNPNLFLFCPTEYCDTRAVPTITSSKYLKVIGEKLHSNIDVLWTGSRVVPKYISVESMISLAKILKRKPLIWENLHANDYDKSRLFLGPYDGRDTDLVNHTKGVLTNPNCEYEANFIAIHTLAQWSKNCVCSFPQNKEKNADLNSHEDQASYQPVKALHKAVRDWIPEFYLEKLEENTIEMPSSEMESSSLSHNTDIPLSDIEMESSNNDNNLLIFREKMSEIGTLDTEDILQIVDLFYLPFEYGPRAIHLLKKANWLLSNVDLIRGCTTNNTPKKEDMTSQTHEWFDQAMIFHDCHKDLSTIIDKFINIPNRQILYEFYQYISDIRSVLYVVNSFIKWNGLGRPNKEPFKNNEQEPWFYRGGIQAEFMRLLPFNNKKDLFYLPPQTQPLSTYTIRPYTCEDKTEVYALCRKTFDDGEDGSDLYLNYPDLPADQLIGSLLSFSSDLCYVVEDVSGICAYSIAIPDIVSYKNHLQSVWIPLMKEKYPKSDDSLNTTPKEANSIGFFHEDSVSISEEAKANYPAYVQLTFQPSRIDNTDTILKLNSLVLKLLCKSNVIGVHTTVPSKHLNTLGFHMKALGFINIDEKIMVCGNELLVLGQKL